MKYTPEEALSEIMHRSERIALQKIRRSCHRLGGICSAMLLALILNIMVMSGEAAETSSRSLYGAFLLNREAGGYVLIALIAFVLGVAMTLLCQRYRKRKTSHKEGCYPDGQKE